MKEKSLKRISNSLSHKFSFVLFISISLLSCNRNIDSKIENCYNINDTLINMEDLYPEEWDTLYYFAEGCSLDELEKRIGATYGYSFVDIGSKLLLVNKPEVIYNRGWEVTCDEEPEGVYFLFENDPKIVALPRNKTKFLIKRRGRKSFWVIHQE